jgi:hypothetical protein
MRLLILIFPLIIGGCAPKPQLYAETLASTDPKYNSAECREIRLRALGYDDKTTERAVTGLALGLFLGPFGLPIAAAVDANQNQERRMFAREVHLRCSSQPLPDVLKSSSEREPPEQP